MHLSWGSCRSPATSSDSWAQITLSATSTIWSQAPWGSGLAGGASSISSLSERAWHQEKYMKGRWDGLRFQSPGAAPSPFSRACPPIPVHIWSGSCPACWEESGLVSWGQMKQKLLIGQPLMLLSLSWGLCGWVMLQCWFCSQHLAGFEGDET